MRALAPAAVVIACALGTSACAGSYSRGSTSTTKTDAIELHESTSGPLPQPLRSFLRSIEAGASDGPVREIDVYGPGSRAGLVQASSGDIVVESPREQKESFYLIVLYGRFVCESCSRPAGAGAPRGTVETQVWSPAEGGTDFGISNGLPAAVSRLHRLATITLS